MKYLLVLIKIVCGITTMVLTECFFKLTKLLHTGVGSIEHVDKVE